PSPNQPQRVGGSRVFWVLPGPAPLLLPLLKKGGAGCITATSNLVARDLAYVFRHFNDGDAGFDAAQRRGVGARGRAATRRTLVPLKPLLANETGHAGCRRLRPPLLPLSQED